MTDTTTKAVRAENYRKAAQRLYAALSTLDDVDQWEGFVAVAQNEIRAAMALLGMEEKQ